MMKHTWFAVVMLMLVMGVSGIAQAHPASDVQLSFDKKTSTLTVTVLHKVRDASKHFINLITVKLNDKDVITQKFSSQTDNEKQVAQYTLIDAKVGDTITASTTCNMGGDKTGTMKIEK